ncbi:hypothetical protein [Hoylesella oralis]|jgi:hypothetical protein|uniref:hypothetical protein n=1 Tax=Hoylesella oralis TaxID=28134 RepID=UPI0028F02E13|nr:hypothetical protein [Hoylesella oralis]
MRKILVMLLLVFSAHCVLFAQTKTEQFPKEIKDSLKTKSQTKVVTDTTYPNSAVCNAPTDSTSVEHNVNKDAFKMPKYDAFWEKMKKPWLGDVIRSLLRWRRYSFCY